MPYVQLRDIELHYEEEGVGPPVLYAHGGLSSLAYAEAYGFRTKLLSAHGFRVLSYDARGHGRSGYSTRAADYRPEALASDMLGLLDALGIERVSICGSSMGASTALMLALKHPERVAKLVLRSPPAFGSDMDRVRRRFRWLTGMYRFLGVPLTTTLAAAFSKPEKRAKVRTLLGGQRRAAIVPALRGLLSEPVRPEILGQIQAPSLIFTQPHDFLHPLRSGEILRDRLPRAELRVAPTLTYWEEERDELAQIIAAWLKGGAV